MVASPCGRTRAAVRSPPCNRGQAVVPFRQCRIALWSCAGDSPGSQFPCCAQIVSVPDRAVGCREDKPSSSVFSLDQALTRADNRFRARCRDTPAIRTTRIRRRIGVVFQDFRLLDHLTTYENVALALRVVGKPESRYRADVLELLNWVGLGDRINAYPPVLSGGEKQRAAIARAVIGHPEILLADEPTGNVDPPMARRLLRLFVELNRLGTSVVIATHDTELMQRYPARTLVLEEGRLDIHD